MKLSNCLRFAATHVPAPPKLWAKPVSSYVEGVVIEHFKAPVYQDLRTRTRLQLLHQVRKTIGSAHTTIYMITSDVSIYEFLQNVFGLISPAQLK